MTKLKLTCAALSVAFALYGCSQYHYLLVQNQLPRDIRLVCRDLDTETDLWSVTVPAHTTAKMKFPPIRVDGEDDTNHFGPPANSEWRVFSTEGEPELLFSLNSGNLFEDSNEVAAHSGSDGDNIYRLIVSGIGITHYWAPKDGEVLLLDPELID